MDLMPKWFMVFDVESVGLHGEGFAVGWVIVSASGTELSSGCHACNPIRAIGDIRDRDWVMENVPIPQSGFDYKFPEEIRTAFWNAWLQAKAKYDGIVLAADCAWPVEARFLLDCVQDDPARSSQGPYPLHEIAMYLQLYGHDPMATYKRVCSHELPKHDPLADARQSAHLLINAINDNEQPETE